MKPLQQGLRDYLALRRSLGTKMKSAEYALKQFLTFMAERKATRITSTLVLAFVTGDGASAPKTMAQRLSAVRGFALYKVGDDPATEVPPYRVLSHVSQPAQPYLYSQEEIGRILDAAKNHPPWHLIPGPWCGPFHAWSYHCIIGLLVVTGMRVSEVLNLQAEDINWKQGILTVRNTKFGKSRLVPLHASTLQALTTYAEHRDRFFKHHRPRAVLSRFFVTSTGNRLFVSRIDEVFVQISRRIGLRKPTDSRGPRLHDFRHRFAVETLLRWYREGENVERLLPVLSTYLGHTLVASTYWYLRCTPELLLAAGHRLERRWKGVA